MADGYGDSGLMTNEPVLSLDEMIRRNRAIRARKEEISRREDELRRLAEQQAASQVEDPGSVEGRQRHKEAMRKGPVYQAPTPKPKTVNVDGTDMPYDEAVSKIPDQMDFEQQLLSSPLAKRALRRRRTEDLVNEGKSPEEAEQIAIKEQQGRAAAFELGQETIRNSPGYMPKEVRALGSGLTNSAVAMGARILGYDQVADEAEATRAGISSEMSGIRDAQHPYPEVMGALAGATESSIQMLPGMIASPVAGPTAGMAIMAGQFGTQEYSNAAYEGAEAGLSGDELTRYAAIQGGVEASIMPIFSKIPGLAGLEGRVLRQNIARTMAKNPKLRQAIAEGAFKLGKDVSSELAEEITTEVLHGFATESGLNQKVNYPEIIKDTVLQTLVMMGSAQVGESIGSVAGKGDLFGMRKPTPEATPVFPDQQPADDPNSFTQIPIDEMIQRRDAAAGSQPTIPPEVEAFTANPSRTKYEAAVKAGLPPLAKSTETTRKKYAADLLKDPFGMRKPDLSGSSSTPGTATPPSATPDPATLEPVPETMPESVPVNRYDKILSLLQKGDSNEQVQASQNADEAQGRQVQTERLLSDLPAGTQDPAQPAAMNESPTPAAHTDRAEFEKEYRDTFKKLMSYPPDQAGHQIYVEKMADLFDAHPDWADEIEQTKTSPEVTPGDVSPDQPASPMADPVSTNESPSKNKMEVYLDVLDAGESRPYSAKFKRDTQDILRQNADASVKTGSYNTFGGDPSNVKVVAKLDAVREYLESKGHKVGPVTHNEDAGTSSMTIEPAKAAEPRRGIVGDMLGTGEVVQTSSGRSTTPFPKIALDTSRKVSMTLRKAEEWLQSNALAEAESRGDDFNATQFRNEKPGKMPKATKDSMEEYLFGEQPAVVPSILKPLVPTKPTKEQLSRPAQPSAKPSIKPLPIAGNSLRSIVLAQGGISAKSLRKDYSQKNLKSDGLLGVMRITGQPLDELAQMLESSGDLRVPEGRTAADYLLEQLKANADGARAQYSDAEIEAQLEAERKLYDQRKEYGFEAEVLDGLRERSEEAETLAVDAGAEEFRPFTEEEAAEIIDTSFDFGANVESAAADEKFELKRPKKPKPKAEDFGTNPNSKQGGLFDAGKKGDKKGQELLFNSDPGDLNNPRTQENKPKAEPPTQSQPESEIEAAMAAELDRLEAEEAAAKKPKPPKSESKPAKPRKPRTKTGEKLGELSEKTGNARKDAAEAFLKKMKGLGLNSALGPINKEALTAAATMVRAYIADNTVKFADFVMKFAEDTSPEIARKFSDYLEAAWKVSGQRNSNLDPAGKVADVLGPEKATSETKQPEVSGTSPALVLVDSLETELLKTRGIDAKRLWELADKAYGGTRAEGKYGPSEAYDALETAINLTILDARGMGLKTPAGQVSPEIALKNLLDMQKQIVSQTNRSGTKDTMQQFSTPPAYSYVVSQFVNMDARDVVLEPSAGTGDLAVHALNQRAKVHVNELDPKRAEMLKAVQEQADDGRLTISTEDALQLGNIMGQNLRPSVVLMNPPFSREGQRMGDIKMSGNDRNHIDAAMGSLIDGGRLVAIIGAGLHGPSKGFTNWLADTAKKHNVRANIEVSRDVYKGYGTTFPTRVLVIDKGTPTPKDGTMTAQADSLEHLLTMTKGIRNDRNRPTIQPVAPGQNGSGRVDTNEGGQQPKVSDRPDTAASDSSKPDGNASGRPKKASGRTSGTGDRNVADDTGGRTNAADSKGTGSNPVESSESSGGGTTDAAGEPTGNLAGESPKPRRVAEKRTEIDESVLFEPYQPSIVPFPNAKPHPTAAVESAAMSAVEYPEVNEVPNIDAGIIEDGRLSDVQLEFVALAAHAHNKLLPSGERTGILFGDGTGMGKGRGIPGVILHNWNEGRRTAIWMSKNGKLHSDAMREWEELGGNPAQVANLSDMPVDDAIDLKEGILFATYDTLKSRGKSGKTRESQVTDWLPADFDGVIAFDEAHLMGSDTAARAGVARGIQDKFPKARIVYASATAATEIDQLMFGSRLGLWGAATPFATAMEFAAKIGSAGVSAMESVALSLKAMGRYVSRSISFNDGTPDGTVGYKRLSHTLADHQVQMYDRLAEAWQKVIGEFENAMDDTGADNFARGFARGQFWSAHQRFFNDLVTSLQMPTVIESIEKDLEEGRSVVIQLTTTGAAQQARALAGRGTQSLDDFAVDPFSALVELVRSQFPTQAYEDYVKDDGSVGKRPVVDSAGKPVKDAAAVEKQQQLLSDLAEMEQSMPDSPLDMILNYFGTENVAEVTGRSQRVVWQEQQDGTKKRVLEKRSQKKSNQADIDAFQEGKKRILVFSQAGGTGASYHADRRASNQQKRMHYLVQPGWVAADAIQGLGRTHRTNQKQAPEYILVQTDIPGQKRFISTIARRLTQLGALTRGQRTAGGSGVFDATDNLESTEAALALTEFFKSLENEDSVMTIQEFEDQTGLELRLRSTGQMKSDVNLPDITSFMNRMLSMKIDSQNKVFDQFDTTLKKITEARRISGELDQGVETIKGSDIRKTRDEVVFTHDSGAKTRYVQLTMEIPIPSRDFATQSKAERFKDFVGYYKRKSDGRVFFVSDSFAKTTKSGQVVDMVRLVPPYGEALREEEYTLRQGKLEKIMPSDAEALWNEQFGNRPKTKSQKVDMITGAVIPIWDRLPLSQPKLSRALTASGDMVLGVVLPPSKVNETLDKLGAEKNKVDVGETIRILRTGKGDVQLVNGWMIQRVRVQNEWRLEIVGPSPVSELVFQRQGVIIERIGFKARYFIPVGDNTQTVFEAVTRGNPVQKVNRYDSVDSGDDVVEEPPAETPDPSAGSAEAPISEARQAANEAQASVDAQKAENAKQNAIIVSELQRRSLGGAGIPVSDELARAVATRLFGEIRLGVKRFDALIKSLRADLSESDIIALKPMLISIWNAIRNKKGLDEATEADFDSAMSDTVDIDLEQAIEAAKAITPAESQNREPSIAEPSTPTPDPATQPTATGDDRTYSTKLAATDAERARIGMADRPAKERQSREASINIASAFGKTEAGRKEIDILIGELTVRPRATTPFENDLLNFRYAELDQKYEAALNQQNNARENGDDVQQAVGEREASLNLKAMMDLIEITSGGVSYALGAGLQARKAIINRDFSMARSVLEFEAAFGREPSTAEKEEMQKEIDDLKASQEQLRKLLDEASEDIESLEASLKRAHEGKVRQPREPKDSDTKKTPTQKADTPRQKAAREKIDNAYKRLKTLLQEGIAFSVGGALAESGSVFLDLATGYSELGVINLGTFLSRVTKRMGPAAKNLLPQLTAAWRQVRASADAADTSSITDRIDRDSPDTIGRAARDLHAFVIERDGLDASPEGRESAVAAVHEILVDIVPELTLEETARAMSGIGIYSELSDNEIDVIRRDQKAQLLLLEQIVDWKKGQAPPATGQERAPVSDQQRELRKAVNEAKKASGISTTTEGQLRSALDAAKRLAANRIADLTKAIESGNRITVSRKLLTPDAELTALQAERDALQKLYDEAFGKRELSDEQRLNLAEKALDRAISNLEADLKSGKLYPDSPKARATSPEIDAKQAILDALKASREEMRLSSGEAQERSDAAYERHLLERDAELARQLADPERKPAQKKPERVLTPAMLKTMLSIHKKQEALLKRRKAWEFQNRHIIYKAWMKGPVYASGMIRKGLTTIDQSLIARQGWLLGITHPIIYGKSIRQAFASNWLEAKSMFPTEQDLFNTEAALDADANWVRMEKIGKVAVTGVHGGMKKTEENYSDVPEWFDKWVPGVAGSERAGSAFINTQRRLVFRELVKQLATKQGLKGESSVSSADLRVIGNLVNVASGRASLGRWENAIQAATTVFFSPRWWASRLQTLIGQPLWYEARWTGGEGASKEARLLAAKEWGTQAFAQVAIMTLAVAGLKAAFGAPGDDEEWDWYADPKNPNFGRIRIGSTYLDMTAGLGQHVALLGRMVTGKQVNRWETADVDRFRMVTNHLRGKLAPTPGIFADWLDGQSIGQDPFGSKEWFAGKAVPLSIQDFVKTMNEESRTLGIIVSALMFFGMGAQTREARTKARSDVANELRSMQNQNTSPQKIQATLTKHLTHTAGLEAKEKLRTANPEEVAALEKVISGESSPELTEAIQKEKYDITLRALEMLSTEDRKKEKKPGEDKGIETARTLLRTIAPTYDEADALFKSAYRNRNGLLVEKVGGRYVPKKSVQAARRRLKAIYAD